MRSGAIVFLSLLLSACASEPKQPPAAPLAAFRAGDVAQVNDALCKDPQQNSAGPALCAYGWRPMGPNVISAQAVDTYQLFWDRAGFPLVTVRVARFPDGSGALWVTRYEQDAKGARDPKEGTLVNILSADELAPLAQAIDTSRFWSSGKVSARAASDKETACAERARWILEGVKKEDRRAVSTANCDMQGQWVVMLGKDMLSLAQQKIPGLQLDPIY